MVAGGTMPIDPNELKHTRPPREGNEQKEADVESRPTPGKAEGEDDPTRQSESNVPTPRQRHG